MMEMWSEERKEIKKRRRDLDVSGTGDEVFCDGWELKCGVHGFVGG